MSNEQVNFRSELTTMLFGYFPAQAVSSSHSRPLPGTSGSSSSPDRSPDGGQHVARTVEVLAQHDGRAHVPGQPRVAVVVVVPERLLEPVESLAVQAAASQSPPAGAVAPSSFRENVL